MSHPTVFVSITVDEVAPNQFEVWVGNDLCGTYSSRAEAMVVAQTYVSREGKKTVVPSSKLELRRY